MNIKRAKEEIKNTVLAYLKKDSHGNYLIPIIRQRPLLLMGPPGIGKTQIMRQTASECGIGLVSYTITHHTRQSAIGLPFLKEKTYGDRAVTVTEYTMSEIIASIYDYMETTGKKEGILFIDEINCVSETLAPTMLQFLQCKSFGNQTVPTGWIIVAAGNPPEYNKSVRDFDFVTLDRVRKINVEADLPAFKEYARNRQIHPFILSYLELKPQNFYRLENDVDGMAFVTARGWEDLSSLVTVHESLSLPVDEQVIIQYLQHEEVAKDLAAYYDLYQKYRDDYDIRSILQGQAQAGIYQRLLSAAFDERLSCVELLVSGLHTLIKKAMETDRLTEECYSFLKKYQSGLMNEHQSGLTNEHHSRLTKEHHSGLTKEPQSEPKKQLAQSDQTDPATENGLWQTMLTELEEEGRREERAGLLSEEQKDFSLKLSDLLRSFTPRGIHDPKEAFNHTRARFDDYCQIRTSAIETASSSLEHAFSFMEEAFGEGQEMVIFVTELTMDPFISDFITQNGCPPFFHYNKKLLIGSRRAGLLAELERDML